MKLVQFASVAAILASIVVGVAEAAQADYLIEYEQDKGKYDEDKDMITLEFTNEVDVLQFYPYGVCKNSDGSNEITSVDTDDVSFELGNKKIELYLKQGIRDNGDVYTQDFDDGTGDQNDVLKFCVYAATTHEDDSSFEIGYAQVDVMLTYTSAGILTNIDIVNTEEDSIADANENNNAFVDEFTALQAVLCDSHGAGESGTETIGQGQSVGICITFEDSKDIPEFRMKRIVSCEYDMGGAVTQDAIGANSAANVLTTYSYDESPNGCDLADDSTECSELFFESVLKADFYLDLSGTASLKLNCVVQVIPILKGASGDPNARRLASALGDDQYEVELDLTIEGEDDGNNLILIIAGAVGGVCLLCLICCLVACAKRRRRDDEDEDNEKPVSEEDDGQRTVDSANISSDVGEAPEA